MRKQRIWLIQDLPSGNIVAKFRYKLLANNEVVRMRAAARAGKIKVRVRVISLDKHMVHHGPPCEYQELYASLGNCLEKLTAHLLDEMDQLEQRVDRHFFTRWQD